MCSDFWNKKFKTHFVSNKINYFNGTLLYFVIYRIFPIFFFYILAYFSDWRIIHFIYIYIYIYMYIDFLNNVCLWVEVGGFSKVVATFSHVGGSFNLFMATTGDVWIIPSFFLIWDYVLHVEHLSCVITNCGQHHHPFTSLISPLGFGGGKHYQKITVPVFRLFFQNFAIPGYFPDILFYSYILSFLSSGWFVIAVCGFVSVKELGKL